MFKSFATLGILLAAGMAQAQTTTPLQKSCPVQSHAMIMIKDVEVRSDDRATAQVTFKVGDAELVESCTVGYSSETDSTVTCGFGGSEIKLWLSGSTSSLTVSGPDVEGKLTSDTTSMNCSDIAPEEVD